MWWGRKQALELLLSHFQDLRTINGNSPTNANEDIAITGDESLSPPVNNFESCRLCNLDGFIYNPGETGIPWEDITDLDLLNKTNCTNVSMFVPIPCPEGVNNSTCGNGICDAGENSINCPQDCTNASNTVTPDGETPQISIGSGANEPNSNIDESFLEKILEGEDFYRGCTIDGKCVTLIGEGESICSKDNDCNNFEGLQTKPRLGPMEKSDILNLILKLFGLKLP